MSALDVWGLDEAAETVYRAMLRNPGLDPAQFARHLQLEPTERSSAAVDGLVRAGLVAPAAGRGWRPAPAGHHPGRAGARRALRPRGAPGPAGRGPGQPGRLRRRPHGGPVAGLGRACRSSCSAPRSRSSRSRTSSAVRRVRCSPATRPSTSTSTHRRTSSCSSTSSRPAARCAASTPTEVARRPRPAGLRTTLGRRRRGGAPDHPALPPMAVFGDEAALVASSWGGGPSTGRLLVRAPALVALVARAVRAVLDAGRQPLGPAPARLQGDERPAGARAAAARRQGREHRAAAGVSLRTVRRRVADLMVELGAATRFQAGMEAARRGLL